MSDIIMRLGRDMLVLEGAMGTMLHREGFGHVGVAPEMLNLLEPDVVTSIHRNYVLAGADCSISNTFGASAPKLAEHGSAHQLVEINRAGMKCARAGGAFHILADMGPTGLMMEPLGEATFDEIYDAFAQQAEALSLENPDAFLLETFTDIAELRAAVLACKEVASEIPVIASITCNAEGHMELSGTDPATAAIILEAVGADAVGINCGLGPEQFGPLLEQMVSATRLPVIAQPNAGIPFLDERGETIFPGTDDEMGAFAIAAREIGVAAVGSCCGSTPRYTAAIADEVSDLPCIDVDDRGFALPVVAGPRSHVVIGEGKTKLIGERINPTGKQGFIDELLAGTFESALRFAREQEQAGADLLDVNVGGAGVDEVMLLPEVVRAVSGVTNLPLVIDTSNVEALEPALKMYPGRALINSVNADPASFERVFPLAKKYGACMIALALHKSGIPETAEARMKVIKLIAHYARQAGIEENRFVVDALVMTQAADPTAPQVTIETMKLAREAGFTTVLGISNVSHGLPNRAAVNAAFFDEACAAGLDAAIVNPLELRERDGTEFSQSAPPEDISTLSMAELAEKFKSGEIFLPQLMMAIDAIKARKMSAAKQGGVRPKGTVIFATVHGDIHSIGKDICVALLESQDYEVIDLGVDVPVERIVEVARHKNPLTVCLSALMTTTLPSMRATIDALEKEMPGLPVCVGGAVVTKAWAQGARAQYSEDAPSCVTLVDSLKRDA